MILSFESLLNIMTIVSGRQQERQGTFEDISDSFQGKIVRNGKSGTSGNRYRIIAVFFNRAGFHGYTGGISARRGFAHGGNDTLQYGGGHVDDPHGRKGGFLYNEVQEAMAGGDVRLYTRLYHHNF